MSAECLQSVCSDDLQQVCKFVDTLQTKSAYHVKQRGSCVVYEPLDRYVDRHIGRDVGRHIDRCSTDMSVVISTDSRPMCRSRCVGRHIGRCVDRYVGRYVDRHISIDISAECRSTCRSIGYRHSADTSLLLAHWWLAWEVISDEQRRYRRSAPRLSEALHKCSLVNGTKPSQKSIILNSIELKAYRVPRGQRLEWIDRELKHARFWDADGKRKWAIFPYNSSHNHIYNAKYVFSIRDD